MNDRNYSTICRLLFPQPEQRESAALNGRTLLSNAVGITDEGNLHGGVEGGRAVFRAPTTPRLEYLSAFDTDVFVKITYIGTVHVQFWGYPPEQSGRLMEERRYAASRLDTQYLPIAFDICSSGYFDIHINFRSEGAVFALSIVREQPKENWNNIHGLSRYVFPKKYLCTEEQLYFRLADDAGYYSYEEANITLFPYKYVEFSTYFNAFSCGKWCAHTTVEDLLTCLDFQGTCLVEVWHALSEEVHHKVYADIHVRATRGEIRIPLGKLSTFETGILYLKIYSLERSRIYGGYYATSTPKTSNVHLGIVITTYKREEDVKKTVATLSGTLPVLVEDPIALVVVDNGQTLRPEDVTGATLLPNRNLGGSGGFMRGLIHLEDTGHVTHCLFMDDDAFCEPESIARTRALLMYRREDNLAVAGAMLLKEHMHIQHENGAYFDYVNHPVGGGLEMNKLFSIIENERDMRYPAMYGAWWFFAFPLRKVQYYTFPIFVRGDDILFSLKNNFFIITLNGINSWQGSFSNKNTPIVKYFEFRSLFLLNTLLNKDIKYKIKVLRMFVHSSLIYCFSYHYETASAIIRAFSDFLSGPEFWVKNIDMYNIFKMVADSDGIKNVIGEENNKDSIHAIPYLKQGIYRFFIILMSLCGHIYPEFMLDRRIHYFIYQHERTFLSAIYRKKYVRIHDKESSILYTIERDQKKFFKLFFKVIFLSIKFLFITPFLYKKYELKSPYLLSRNFWKHIFSSQHFTKEKVL